MKYLVYSLMLVCSISVAQTKIAHLSFDSLVSGMPETKMATDAAQKYLKGLEEEMLAMKTEFETKYKKYMDEEATMPEMVKKTKMEDLQQLQGRIQDFQNQAQNEYQKKQMELMAPIIKKARKGIQEVAKENGYKFVLDNSSQGGTVLYSELSDDVFSLVKKKLDAMPAAEIPGSKPAETAPNKPVNRTSATKPGK